MRNLAVPYYGNLYRNSTGYERVYFIVDYDTETEQPQAVRLGVWDKKRTPELCEWLRENGVHGIICRDVDSVPVLDSLAKKGITVLKQGSRCAQIVMESLLI